MSGLLTSALVAARSPVFSHLSSSLQGLWTIRAFRAEQRFQEAFDAHQDLHSRKSLLYIASQPAGADVDDDHLLISVACRGVVPLPHHLSLVCAAPGRHLLRLCRRHHLWLPAPPRP